MRLIAERKEGERIPQGLSVTHLPSNYRRYILRLWDVKASLSLLSEGGIILSLDTVTLKNPEYPGQRMMLNLLEVRL